MIAELDSPQGGLKRRTPKGGTSSSNSSSSVMEVDEEDAAIINETKKMGYCYFRRELTEEEKRINAQNRPTRIAEDASPQSEAGFSKDQEKASLLSLTLACLLYCHSHIELKSFLYKK